MMRKIIAITLFFHTLIYASDYSDISLDRLIGQMIVVNINGTNKDEELIRKISTDASLGRISGMIFYSKNIKNQTQLKQLTTRFKNIAVSNPLFIAIDEEGGDVSRIDSITKLKLPSAKDVANNYNLLEAKALYEKKAKELKEYGFNLNFAPVVDVGDGSLKDRVYSSNEDITTLYAKEYANALKNNNILYTLKHFPGQGDLQKDIHTSNAILRDYNIDHLKPFYAFLNTDDVDMIMVSHVVYPTFDPLYPASMSEIIINKLLRNKLGYDGVVISDDVLMGGLDSYKLEDRVVKMINSGVDVLLFSGYFMRGTTTQKVVTDIIKNAVKDGIIKRERLEQSYARIVKLKQKIKNAK